MKKNKIKEGVDKLVRINALYLMAVASVLSFVIGGNLFLSPFVGVASFFSWRIFVSDIKARKINNLDIAGLLLSGGLVYLLVAPFDISIIRAIVVFLIGWGMFQLFEGDIGGGDVRLVTVGAVFLNLVQLLAAVSLASALGMLIGYRFKIKRIPFGSLLIISFWLSFWIVRF